MMKKKISTPEEILPAGDDYALVINPFTGITGKARKGTVAATLNNIALLNQVLLDTAQLDQIHQVKEEIVKLIPSLKVIGIFDLFKLEEWITDDKQLGRIYVTALYLKHHPEEMNQRIAMALKKIKQTTQSTALRSTLEEITLP